MWPMFVSRLGVWFSKPPDHLSPWPPPTSFFYIYPQLLFKKLLKYKFERKFLQDNHSALYHLHLYPVLTVYCQFLLLKVKVVVFPVVMYRCESWTIKKAECRRIDAFELWCWRRLLRVPWTTRRSNQSVLKEISPEYSLKGLILKLKLQYFGQLMWRTNSLEKTWCWERLKAGGEGDNRGWDGWMASLTWWTWIWVGSWSWWWIGRPGVLQSMELQNSGTTEPLNWTEPHTQPFLLFFPLNDCLNLCFILISYISCLK